MAATSLATGGIAVVSYETDLPASGGFSPDALRFVLLEPIGAGTVIYFTDRSWSGTAFAAGGGGEGTFTYTALTDQPAGTVVTVTGTQLNSAGIALSNNGETLYAYQGSGPNAPSRFLYAIEFADGDTAFTGSLANTGLTAGKNAVAIAWDNAAYTGMPTQVPATQLKNISTAAQWDGSDTDDFSGTTGYSEVFDTTVNSPLFNNPDMVLVAAMNGGGPSDALLRIGSDEGTAFSSLTRLFRDDPQFHHVSDVSFDLDRGYFFFVDSDGNDINRVMRGNVADLVSGTTTPTFTQLFATDNLNNGGGGAIPGELIVGLEVNTATDKIYWMDGDLSGTYEGGFQLWEANYDGSQQRLVTTLDTENPDPNYGFTGGVGDFAIRAGTNTAYVVHSTGSIDFQGNVEVLQNHILQVNLATGAVTSLPVGTADAGYAMTGRLDPAQYGQIMALDVDQNTGDIYFVTQAVSAGAPAGIYRFSAGGGLTTLWSQPPNNAYSTLQDFPTANLTAIEFDEASGRYFVSTASDFDTENDGTPSTNESDAAIFVGSAAGGAPTLYVRAYEPVANGAPAGMEIDYAPVLGVTGAGATYTETAGANSPAGAGVAVLSGTTLSDRENAVMWGATVAITSGFVAGDQLQFTAGNGITGTYDTTTGVLTLTGAASLAHYRTALESVRFTNAGDNPTAYGASPTRTIAFTTTDGLAASDAVTATVTVVGVNDAPTITAGGTAALSEDASATAFTGVSIADADADPASHLVTTTFSVAHGTLGLSLSVAGGITAGQASASSGTSITVTATVAQVNATLAAGGLTYTPAANFNGADALAITVNDAGHTGTDPGASGDGSSEQGSGSKTIAVAAVNDAPVVFGIGAQVAGAILEDQPGSGQSVSALFGSRLDDSLDAVANGSSAHTLAGIAIVANGSSAATGQWQYNDGAGWVNIGAASASAAPVVSATALLRFNPAANFNGAAPTLTVHLVDSSGGAVTSGATVDLSGGSATGGTTRYTAGTIDLLQQVTALNDAPTATGLAGDAVTALEDNGPVRLDASQNATLADVDSADFGGGSLRVAITAGGATAEDALGLATVGGVTVAGTEVRVGGVAVGTLSGGGVGGGDLVIDFNSAATPARVQELLRVLSYSNAGGDTPTAGARTVTWTLVDGDGNDAGAGADTLVATTTVTVQAVNDAPTGGDVHATVAEDTTYVFTLDDFEAGFSDPEGQPLAAVKITVLPANGAGELRLASGGTGPATPVTAGQVISRADIEAGKLLYRGATDGNGTNYASFKFVVGDGGGTADGGQEYDLLANTFSFDVTPVNDDPVLDLDTGSVSAPAVTFTEASGAVRIAPLASFSDVDWGNPVGASVSVDFTANGTAADQLGVHNEGNGADQIGVSGSTVSYGGVALGTVSGGANGAALSITFGAAATAEAVQALLRNLSFDNTSQAPSIQDRTLSVTVVDANGGRAAALATVRVIGVNSDPTGSVTVTGTARQGETLTAANTLADGDGIGEIHYQWRAGGQDIQGATDSTLTLEQDQVGKAITVVASYTDAGGYEERRESGATDAVENVNDEPVSDVSINGNAQEGVTLSANTGTLQDPDGTAGSSFTYQWLRDGTAIDGQTTSTYSLGDADVGHRISVRVDYVDQYGTAETSTSDETGAVANLNDNPTGGVTLTGSAVEGGQLQASNNLADNDGLGTVSYVWLRNGAVIDGATGDSYTLVQADVGARISVRASYTDGHGTTEQVTSTQTAEVQNVDDEPQGGVTIVGSAQQHAVLQADTTTLADEDGLGTLQYQWLRDGKNIADATDSTYTLVQDDVNSGITVVVRYTDGQGHDESVESGPTDTVANVDDAPTGSVTVSGTAQEDELLNVSNDLADLDGLGPISYQWLREGQAIADATGSSYLLTQADVKARISVAASYTDGFGQKHRVESLETLAVANVQDEPVGTVTLTGTAQEDLTLTAVTSAITDEDGLGTFGYTWLRNNQAIDGATGASYTLGQADVGAEITVVVSYTDGQGTLETLEAQLAGKVGNVNDDPSGGVTIAGDAVEDAVLTLDTSTLGDEDGLGTLSYQWLRGGKAIDGATDTSYTLGQDDVGFAITVQVSYTDQRGTDESVESQATVAVANVNDDPTGGIAISGKAEQGTTLTADTVALADEDGLGTLSYQWWRDGKHVQGATQSTYVLGQADVGFEIGLTVSYTDEEGQLETVAAMDTGAIDNVNDDPGGALAIVGTAWPGRTLTLANTLSDLDGLGEFSYQWLLDGVAIDGATGATYVVLDGDLGGDISVEARWVDGFGTAEVVESLAVRAEAEPEPPAGTQPGQGVTLTAPPEGGTVEGTKYDDVLTGLDGRDTFIPNGAKDEVRGGGNIDTLVLPGERGDYTLVHESDGSLTLRSGGDAPAQVVHFSGIERLQFADAKVALDVEGELLGVVGLYRTAFGRDPDEGGLEYYEQAVAQGLDVLQIAQNFARSPEFFATYGNVSDAEFLTQLYQNAFGRAPDAQGFAYQMDVLAQLPSPEDRASLVYAFAMSPEMQVMLAGLAPQGIELLA